MNFRDGSVDGILCGDIIEHIFDIDHFLGELKRVLRPGGWVIFTTPNITSLSDRIRILTGMDAFFSHQKEIQHVRFFTRGSIKKLLSSKGFKIEKAITRNTVVPYFARIKVIKNGLGNLGEKIIVMAKK